MIPVFNRCAVMGVVNVTTDSFSDGGKFLDLDKAIAHGLRLHADGADLVDVGGESTRPGADRVEPFTEINRIAPVIRELSAAGVLVSIDTMRASVAAAAIEAGAAIINDVSGGLADPDMAKVAADAQVPWVLMHWRGHSKNMQVAATYDDVVADVNRELQRQVDVALDAGVLTENIILDPGLGFAKTGEHNWTLLRHMDKLQSLGFPVLVGASRKRFLGSLLDDRPPAGREDATAAITALSAERGAWGVRVHDVRRSADVVRVVEAWRG